MKKSIAYYAKLEWTLGRALDRAEANADAKVSGLGDARRMLAHGEYGRCATELRDVYAREKIDMPGDVKCELIEAFWLMGMPFSNKT